MNNLVLASSSTEAASLEEARARLAESAGTLGTLCNNLAVAAGNSSAGELVQADQGALVDFAEQELIPLATALAGAFPHAAAFTETHLLATVAAGHNERIVAAAKALEVQESPIEVVQASGRLLEAATAFISQATELVLPALAQNPAVSLADVLPKRSTEEAGAIAESQAPASGGCACGGHDEPGLSELDTRVIPHAIRHATIFGALEGLNTGKGILLIANHNPLPLLAQLDQRSPGKFAVAYVEDGPELWKLSMVRN
ncbi:hypothetical protein ART_2450 [Arthrobacter sp. PAMC 25486]|uniref:DUF2249 domain-containing protein n=1 Tax=Arthrobacter sp. PAMC 25486 TaxID=1494608 RepID=UPI0005359F23|nr:DUF2249 domain-containing protein [Arthrobacter sp. PAMC 25486]AIY02049.1 hypothetical protein ART_2450 [Arthrobacter sp. PAMC 25486]